ncbi:cysteine dioxygenase family protein [Pseudomonas sp. H9]|uniref:cysteine dioxygenase family protein n=1 Tax=Pseudomonas sp. H9 TaxID=483968 RepID=UPI0010582221|nr:cysteine dioxygenase family protein [Pseudomonas sp. H9]TDF82342.1 cysteine dioxygenase [Pseudomonas sp. H9]
MPHPELVRFIEQADRLSQQHCSPCDCVQALAPSMLELVSHAPRFLEPEHYRSDPNHYCRNLIYRAEDDGLSLYALVWSPGQWTPVHDHGSWGVVGIVEGVLEERSYVCLSADRSLDEGIDLVRGGVILLPSGSVTSFVPNPDHIHITGVPSERSRAVSLHLYGRMMNNFHIYDVDAGTRRFMAVEHNAS